MIIDLSSLSLVGGSGIAEAKIPLWWADGTTSSGVAANAGSLFLLDGNSSLASSSSAANLISLPDTIPSSMVFAFEGTVYTESASNPLYAELWDMTSNSGVSASQINTTNTNNTVLRSGKFSLSPGHVYGVTLWCNPDMGYNLYISDASLIVFPN